VKERRDGTLQIVQALVRALSHRIRTPLSVVSNELNVYRSLLPGEDVARLIARCQSISELLRSVTVPHGEGESTDLLSALHEVGARVERCDGPIVVALPREQLLWMLHALRALTGVTKDQPWNVVLSVNAELVECRFQPSQPFGGGAPTNGLTLTGFFNEQLDRDLVEPPVIDALLRAFGGDGTVTGGNDPCLVVRIPLQGAS
jgi:hypothetical protein